MYKIKNGILYQNGRPTLALGSGYKGINYYLWRADLGGPEVQL